MSLYDASCLALRINRLKDLEKSGNYLRCIWHHRDNSPQHYNITSYFIVTHVDDNFGD